jgi:hypothetical protein
MKPIVLPFMADDTRTVLGDYRILKTLGQGAFSKVKLAVHVETGEKVATVHSGRHQGN